MSKLNKDSNLYVLGFLAALAIVVALLLAVLSESLKPTIIANKKLDERTKILKAVVFKDANEEVEFFTPEYVNGTYESKVTEQMIDHNGEVVADSIPLDYNYKLELKKPVEEQSIPLYTFKDGGKEFYIMKMIGLGLWDEINGYLAVDAANVGTIQGVAFDHKGETPGLGAEIVKTWFREQFNKDTWMDEEGKFDYTVYKAGKMPDIEEAKAVDGISGATLTTNGVDDMMENTYNTYKNILN